MGKKLILFFAITSTILLAGCKEQVSSMEQKSDLDDKSSDVQSADSEEKGRVSLETLFNKENLTVDSVKEDVSIHDNAVYYKTAIRMTVSSHLQKYLGSRELFFNVKLSNGNEFKTGEKTPVKVALSSSNYSIGVFGSMMIQKELRNSEDLTLLLQLHKSNQTLIGEVPIKENYAIQDLLEAEKKQYEEMQNKPEEEFLQIARNLFSERLVEMRENKPMEAIKDYEIETISLKGVGSDSFRVWVSYSVLPKYPNEYVLAGNGRWPDNDGWVVGKSLFLGILEHEDGYRIASMGTGP